MATLQRGRLFAATILLLLTAFNCPAQTHVFFDVQTVFTTQPPNNTNRVFKIQALSPFPGSFFYRTSDVAGQFYVSNCLATTYSGSMLAPPNSLTFSFTVVSTNLGVVPAQGITSIPANGVQTFPSGATAWSIQASDSRYAFSTNGPGAGLNGSQVTNIVLAAIPSVFWNPVAGSWVTNLTTIAHLDTNTYQPGTFLSATTNSAGVVTFNAVNQTNGITSLAYSNVASFYTVNNPSNYATLIQATNIALNATNALGTAAFFPSNAWYPNANPSFFLTSNTIQGWVFSSTNSIGLSSGLSAYASTNRWDTNGAGTWGATVATQAMGIASGLAAFVPTNIFASSNTLAFTSNALQSQIVGGSITASGVTNIASFLIGVSNAPLSASNSLLFVAKVDSTNGFSTGERATNFNVRGSIGLGDTGQATNIVNGTTNLVKFINAGSSIATNGVFIWQQSLNCYTNWITTAIWTNTGSGWVMATNGISLYSLSGSSPFGASSTVAGSSPAPLAVPTFYFDHNGMQDVGFFSVTNLSYIITNAVGSSGSNFIANLNGIGTNALFYGITTTNIWGNNLVIGTNNAILPGTGIGDLPPTNNIIAGGNGNTIISGNTVSALSTNNAILGGSKNLITNGAAFNVISGGFGNLIDNQGDSFIAGGANAIINNASPPAGATNFSSYLEASIALGYGNGLTNAKRSVAIGNYNIITNYNSLSMNDGTPGGPNTNYQAYFHYSSGYRFMGGPAFFQGGANFTNLNSVAAVAVLGVDGNGTLTTNSVPIPTDPSIAVASNFLATVKLGISNDTSYGQTASNLTLRGRSGFNQATNFLESTNVIKIYAAGTSLATNGSYEWIPAMAIYTNRSTTAILTNNGSQWLLQTNGTALYSSLLLISNAWPAVAGAGTASSAYGFYQVGDGQIFTGLLSSTNLTWQITNAVAQGGGGTPLGTITNIVNGIATNNYLKTNNGIARNPTFLGIGSWTNASSPASSTTVTSNAVASVSIAVDTLSSKSSSTISLGSSLELDDSSILDQSAQSMLDPDGTITSTILASSATNLAGVNINGKFFNIIIGSGLSYNATTTQLSASGGGGGIVFPPNALGILTNNGSGATNWTTGIPYTWIIGASNAINASSNSLFGTMLTTIAATNNNVVIPQINTTSNSIVASLPSQTNFWGVTNAITVGQAVVVDGTNAQGVWQLKGTNWPSGGGGSQTPWAQDIDAAFFSLLDLNATYWTNTTTLNSSVKAFATATGGDDGSVLSFTGRTNNAAATSTLLADRLVAQQQVRVNGGSISVIPTNAAPVSLVTNAPGTSLPMGLTNAFVGRGQPIVQYFLSSGASGTPLLTLSNEQTFIKIKIGSGSLLNLIETNCIVLPVTTTNSVWRARDESGGSGASVGVITNWIIGL